MYINILQQTSHENIGQLEGLFATDKGGMTESDLASIYEFVPAILVCILCW